MTKKNLPARYTANNLKWWTKLRQCNNWRFLPVLYSVQREQCALWRYSTERISDCKKRILLIITTWTLTLTLLCVFFAQKLLPLCLLACFDNKDWATKRASLKDPQNGVVFWKRKSHSRAFLCCWIHVAVKNIAASKVRSSIIARLIVWKRLHVWSY